jgi:hypothetical protein
MQKFSDYFVKREGGAVGLNRRVLNEERIKFLNALEANGLNRNDPIYSLVSEDFNDQFVKVEEIARRLTELTKERKGMEYDFNRVLNVVGSAVDKEGWGEGGSRENVSYTEEQIARDIAEAAEGEEFAALEELKELLDSSTLQGNKIVIPKTILNVQDEEGDPAVYKVSEGETLMGPAVFAKYLRQFEEERGIDLENMLPARFASATGEQLKKDFDELYNNATEQIESSQNIIKEFEGLTKDLVRDTSVVNNFFENVDRPIDLIKVLSPDTLRLIEDQQDLLTSAGKEVGRETSPYGTLLADNISDEYARREALPESPTYGSSAFERERYIPSAEVTKSDDVRRDPSQLAPNDPRRSLPVPEMEAAAIENEIDLEEAEIKKDELQESFIGRVTDESQMVPEFGAPVSTGGGGDGQDPALDLTSRLGDIGAAFNISDQFGYRYFLFDPGTENERQDMLIDDPDNPGTQINVLKYITSKELTNEAEILEAFKQTEWFNETSETMQNFDLAWDAAGPWDNWDNLTARREELIGDEKDYIEDQLELLGITDQVDEAEINKLATFVKRNGMDTGEIRDYLSDVESIDFQSYIADADEGLLGTYKSSLATTAAQYMVELDDDQLNMFVEGLYDADDPAAQLSLFKNQFKNMAKERFPTLSGVIDQGITPQQYFAPYSARVSKLLDRPVDFMSERDSSIFDQIASGMPDEKFGQRTMTFAETNEYVRGLDEWQYTKNANDEARQIANNVGRMFGFVA